MPSPEREERGLSTAHSRSSTARMSRKRADRLAIGKLGPLSGN